MEVSEGEEKEKREEKKIVAIIAENTSNLMKNFNLHTQENQQPPSKMRIKIYIPRYIRVKITKIQKEKKILKAIKKT